MSSETQPSQPLDPKTVTTTAPTSNPTTPTPVTTGRTLLIHGYSASGAALEPWKTALASAGIETASIEVGNYITLNNEVTIKDLGEAFDRALRLTPWSGSTANAAPDAKDDDWTFDAVVHSTGMLVLRQWLVSDPFPSTDKRSRVKRLKHLVGLAPATFGSPQAKQGRSWLGALVKGPKVLGPDFLNAGDKVLDGLELGSSYTWDLAHQDMICPKPLYDMGDGTPYVTVFIGNTEYTWLSSVANSPGCDGTVRWAGCALNTRKVSIDFRREPKLIGPDNLPTRCSITRWESSRLGAPVIAVDGQNHGTIVSSPNPSVLALMKDFFLLSNEDAYKAWAVRAQAFGNPALKVMNEKAGPNGAGWQQLVVHAVDDHGDGITDFNLQLFIGDNLTDSDMPADADSDNPGRPLVDPIPLIVDTYSKDASYRCFYIRLTDDMLTLNTAANTKKMWLELIASSGSDLIEYEAYTGTPGQPDVPRRLAIDHKGGEPVKLDITALTTGDQKLLFAYTTTLLEIFVEREPMPLGKVSGLFNFDGYTTTT